MNQSLRNRILRNSKIISSTILSDSLLFEEREVVSTPIPGINIALSGSPTGGLLPGLLMIAGQSKHFKTAFGLLMVSAFLQKYPSGVVIFYDSEFGSNQNYFKSFGIDPDRIVHSPITNVEEWRHDISAQIKDITIDDKVMIFVDSIGNLASLKEVMDAEEGREKADMTRAKTLKSVFRIIGPHLSLKGIPMVVINHTYKEQSLYPKDIISGGTGAYLNSNDIWIVGRQQDKDSEKELQGFNFIINIEKSRTVKERSKIAINVSFDNGISKYSGLFEMAQEAGLITTPKVGWFQVNGETLLRRRDIEGNEPLWERLLKDKTFLDFIDKKYRLNHTMVEQPVTVDA
jgi:RecA/RadA recombinase